MANLKIVERTMEETCSHPAPPWHDETDWRKERRGSGAGMRLNVWMASAVFALGLAGGVAPAQPSASPEHQDSPAAAPIPEPRDVPYPGVLGLTIDATDLAHRVFSVHETLPVQGAGPLTLHYPKWLPGNHSPSGPIDKLAGLVITARGAPVAWTRDPVDVYAFHLDVPAGAAALNVDFQFLSPVSTKEGRVMMTPDMLDLEWNTVVLYPAGYYSRDIRVRAGVKLPAGFTAATALRRAEGGRPGAATLAFEPTPLDTLVDSPLIAGRYFRGYDLAAAGEAPVRLDVIADRAAEADATPAQVAAHAALVTQAGILFGGHPFDHYDFLLWLSDDMGHEGLEHLQSSEDGTTPAYFDGWDHGAASRDLLPHEFTHAWNGKFRRPADLWTPDFNTPMGDSLLWVYEGQTQYWGVVLAARAGLTTKAEALDSLALTAATYDQRAGRAWRALEDTTNDPTIAQRRPLSWRSWQRSEDYYSEGELIWLGVDTLIRQGSGGQRGLDDFARAFFAAPDRATPSKTYTFEDVVAGLNAVSPGDWAGLLRERLEAHAAGAPLDGLARGGYRLVFGDRESEFMRSNDARQHVTNLSFSLGLTVDKDDVITDVIWDGPAFKAGLTADVKIVAVNGQAYDPVILKDAIDAAVGSGPPIALLIKSGDRFRTVLIDWHGGLRYPRLERIPGTPALLDAILKPRE